MNPNVINEFIKFYISTFNDKTRFTEFSMMWKEYSICVHNGQQTIKETLVDYIKTLYTYRIKTDQQNDIMVSITVNGDRRANILLSYTMLDQNDNSINVSHYLLLAYSNNKEFWIHSSIINAK
jgi:hypothetical protein